ncbi:MAG: DUF3394 domain-containing protein [Proteobacteria bacterium]|nr:MAG: DUF3394 domain-containing protein [Pseudomonadota bacterium]
MADDTKPASAGDYVAEVDTGARNPTGRIRNLLLVVAFSWSLFQLWIASPLPFVFSELFGFSFGILNNTESRSLHLAFAIFLAFTSFPALKRSPRDRVPVQDWVFALVGAVCAAYLFLLYEQLAGRAGDATTYDIVVAIIGVLILLEATRRALGPPLMVVASVFLIYTLFGQYMPDVIAHKGQSLTKVAQHQWLTTEGVFGVALGVSTDFVFLFVLFGALLEQAGAGNYFIRMAFAGLGHMRGGPAKAAVVASASTGLISGSSIANVATTGVFTIPLMKKVGFPATKAGAVEVASSTNGQLTPPVMGAAAFLMVEYVGISYIEVIKHALLPALISYIALVYIVHLEACKAGMEGLERRVKTTVLQKMTTAAFVIFVICLTGLVVYYGVGWVKDLFPDGALYIVSLLIFVVYLGLLAFSTRYPELADDHDMSELPELGPTTKVGLFFFLPIVVLMWCLIVERFSPGLAAFWATALMIFIVVTQRPILAIMRGTGNLAANVERGFGELVSGMIAGARNMVGIGVATAAAGIVVGTITLTGIGQVMIEFVELISGGNLMAALIFTAMICIILGMGLPTTANYIVVSSLMAPVVVSLGAANGLVVPLVAVHMFVFYFGILADDTPPVGLAAFAASAISGADPIKTGIQGFAYDIRTAILPFLFIFNTQLLMIGIGNVVEFVAVVVGAVFAMLMFAAATQGYWLTRSRIWESLALLLIAFTLFRPGFWWDRIYPPFEQVPATEIAAIAEEVPQDQGLRMRVAGETIDGNLRETTVRLPLGEKTGDGMARIEAAGLAVREEDGKVVIDNLMFGTPAEALQRDFGVDFDWEIKYLEVSAPRPPKQIMFIPALILLALVAKLQLNRRRKAVAAA